MLSALCEVGGRESVCVCGGGGGGVRADFFAISSSLYKYVHISVHFFYKKQGFRNKLIKRQDLRMCAPSSVTIATTSVQAKKKQNYRVLSV